MLSFGIRTKWQKNKSIWPILSTHSFNTSYTHSVIYDCRKKFFFTLDKTKPCNIYTILTLLLSLDTNYQKHYHSFPTIHLRSTCIQEEKLLLSSIYKCNRKEDEKLVNSSVVEPRQNIWKPINSFKKNKYFWFITTANKSLVAIRVLDVRLLTKSLI